MARAEQQISRAIEFLHKARATLDKTGATEAVAEVERALSAATFARGAAVRAEKFAASLPKRQRR
jgi:hypothetical protein